MSPDAIFAEPRLAAIYDALDPDRSDLDHYASIVDEFGARSVLDVGCGTGAFALLLAGRGHSVVAVDPAAASLSVARGKLLAERVRWITGDAAHLPALQVDLAMMTGNVAQVFIEDHDWHATLRGIHAALRPDGLLVFESRVPGRKAWLDWTREKSLQRRAIAGVGTVESWVELLEVQGELVSFRWTYSFESDGAVLTSDSTIRFRSRDALADSLVQCGYRIEHVRDAPDRPGREFVFLARSEPRRQTD